MIKTITSCKRSTAPSLSHKWYLLLLRHYCLRLFNDAEISVKRCFAILKGAVTCHILPILPLTKFGSMEKLRQYWKELSRGASSQYCPFEKLRSMKKGTGLKGTDTRHILPILPFWKFRSMKKKDSSERNCHAARPPNTTRLKIQIDENYTLLNGAVTWRIHPILPV